VITNSYTHYEGLRVSSLLQGVSSLFLSSLRLSLTFLSLTGQDSAHTQTHPYFHTIPYPYLLSSFFNNLIPLALKVGRERMPPTFFIFYDSLQTYFSPEIKLSLI
jgi:hypothetical protein